MRRNMAQGVGICRAALSLTWRNRFSRLWVELRLENKHNKGARHDGRPDGGPRAIIVRRRDWLHLRLREAVTEVAMLFDYSLAGLVSLGLLIYLTYALLRPERF
jgi:K+-transporting ATPase KdpF subunit